MSNIKIRKAEIKDAYAVEYVAAHSWKETYTGLMPDDYLDERIRTIKDKVPRAEKFISEHSNYYVVEVDEQVIGILYFGEPPKQEYKEYGYLEAIYVLKAYHGLGIGKELFKLSVQKLIEMGYKKMYLECLKGNIAIEFYKKYLGKETKTVDFPIKDFSVKIDIVEFDNLNLVLNEINKVSHKVKE